MACRRVISTRPRFQIKEPQAWESMALGGALHGLAAYGEEDGEEGSGGSEVLTLSDVERECHRVFVLLSTPFGAEQGLFEGRL